MRFFFLTLCTFRFCILGFSQDKMDHLYGINLDSLSVEEKGIVLKRNWANNFSQSLSKIGDPSIASCAFSDYNYNSDPFKQKKSFILNTTIQPILGIGGKRWYYKNFVHTIQLIPSIAIRVFQNDSAFSDHSMPVRTPGFIARFNYYFSHAKLWNDSLRTKIYFGASFFHHSNGQDGYEFIIDKTSNDSIVNTYNGNFSEIGVYEFMTGGTRSYKKPMHRKVKEQKDSFLRRLEFESKNSTMYWKLGYEYHPSFFTSEKFARYDIYAKNRLNIQLGYLFNPRSRHLLYSEQKKTWIPLENNFRNREIRRLVVNLSYILDKHYNISSYVKTYQIAPFFDLAKRLNIDFTWYERIGTMNDYAIFMRIGYYGSDPYNIYFQESLFIARVGIAFGNFMYGEKRNN